MRDFIVKTNFGHTYKWTPEIIADDYASTAIQWQEEDYNTTPKTYEQLVQEIIGDEEFLTQWFNDYLRGDVSYSIQRAELISVNEDSYNRFVNWCINIYGNEE
nr:MAG TPA: hypothetical protein [Caudoviricetes sp.]